MRNHSFNKPDLNSIKSNTKNSRDAWWGILHFVIHTVIEQLHPAWIVSLVGIFLASGIYVVSNNEFVSVERPFNNQPTALCGTIEYEQIKIGMSLTEVQAILQHRGTEISLKDNIAIFVWHKNEVKITVQFKDGKLAEKKQRVAC